VGALDVLHKSEGRGRAWIFLPVFVIVAGVARVMFHRSSSHSRQVIHNFGG
jgi:hypothetical protein